VLANLLPGVRDLRTPLATGYAYFLFLWLVFGKDNLAPEAAPNDLWQRFYDLSDTIGTAGSLAIVSFTAYLFGSIVRVSELRRPRWLLRLLRSDPDKASDRLELWALQQAATLESRGLNATKLSEREDVPQLFSHRLSADLQGFAVATSEAEMFNSLPMEERYKMSNNRVLVKNLEAVVEDESEALISRLQIGREAIYNDYDRLRSEAELRFTLLVPLCLLVAASGFLWTKPAWLLVGLPLILLGQAFHIQARADERVLQALTTGVIDSPVVEQLLAIDPRV
jgi:hypothetical protein